MAIATEGRNRISTPRLPHQADELRKGKLNIFQLFDMENPSLIVGLLAADQSKKRTFRRLMETIWRLAATVRGHRYAQ
jgi:hypothetical protein